MSVDKMKKLLKKNINKCYYGAYIWHSLLKKHPEIASTAVILLPDSDNDCNYYAMLYINEFLNSQNFNNAVILTTDKRIKEVYGLFSDRIISVIPFSDKKTKYLMQYYTLYEFDRRLIVASLDKPYGRNGSSLVGLKGLTKEEVFVMGVYRLYPFKQKQPLAWKSRQNSLDKLMLRKNDRKEF